MFENNYNNSSEAERLYSYWTEQFSTMIPQSLFFLSNDVMDHTIEQKLYSVDNDIFNRVCSITNNNNVLQYCFFVSVITTLLYKISGQENITSVIPLLKSNVKTECSTSHFYLTTAINSIMTFRSLLEDIKNRLVSSYKNQNINFDGILSNLKLYPEANGLNSVVVSSNTIHSTESIDILKQLEGCILHIIFEKDNNALKLQMQYKRSYLDEEYADSFFYSFETVCKQVLKDVNSSIGKITIISEAQEKKILDISGNIDESIVSAARVSEVIDNVVKSNPNKTALITTIDYGDIYNLFKKTSKDKSDIKKILCTCFEKSKFVYSSTFADNKLFLKSISNACYLLNNNAARLYDLIQEEMTLVSVFEVLDAEYKNVVIETINIEEPCNVKSDNSYYHFDCTSVNGFIEYINLLFDGRFIEFVQVKNHTFAKDYSMIWSERSGTVKTPIQGIDFEHRHNLKKCKTEIVLLGDKPGVPGVGLLYLASYLERNGIGAICRFLDSCWDYNSLHKKTTEMLEKHNPRIVGISMKWFPHIERVYELAKIVKEYDPNIKVCVGGDTASYYSDEVIKNINIDYVVCGDGEVPLLHICQNSEYIPNCLYKKDGRIIKNEIEYVMDSIKCSKDMNLFRLEEIMSSTDPLLFGAFYIPTHKGCSFQCIQCGGCRKVQKDVFNRTETSFWRESNVVRQDIIAAKDYVSTFMFSIDRGQVDYYQYCNEMLSGIDLSSHFCVFFSIDLISEELVKLLCSTFKYVRFNIDICSLSEEHRKKLAANGFVKPQPTDQEILGFFEICSKLDNCDIDIYTISGMPLYGYEDIQADKRFLNKILSKYKCFNDFQWGHLHSQPGALILDDLREYNMKSSATEYYDFLEYSKMNMNAKEQYPSLMYYNYPYIDYVDSKFNIAVMQHFLEMSSEVAKHNQNIRNRLVKYESITYGELDRKSDAIAYQLNNHTFKKNDSVIIKVEDRLLLVASIIAAIKTGVAYIPVDVSVPDDRVMKVISDSNASILLTDVSDHKIIDNIAIINVLEQTDYDEIPSQAKSTASDPDEHLYTIYTSGTTGNPKGIPIKHKSLINYITWRLDEYGFSDKDITLQLISESFDGFASNLFSSLFSAGCLVIPSLKHKRDYAAIQDTIEDLKITNTSIIPSMYELLLEDSQQKLESLRFVVLAGEKMSSSLIEKSNKLYGHIQLINEYGPTENTVTTTACLNIKTSEPNIIGKPIRNVNVYILNSDNQLMPIGMPGEICISGIGLFDGYINNPLLNEQKLVSNPYAVDSIMYKSGDIGVWLSDCNIRYIGRLDRQVKIRGFRVELDDIEQCIKKCSFIKDSAVVLKNDYMTGNYICAFIVPNDGFSKEYFMEEIKKEMPDYLIPNKVLLVDDLPKALAGKTNYHELQRMNVEPIMKPEIEQNLSETENAIYNIWKTALGKDYLNVNDNFFEIGGNSLKLMDVYMEISKLYPTKVSVTDLFSYPTISKLAEFLECG
ncbi:MAG: amino acid adenylation domain-containing protein [Bacillota bacterium]